MENNLGPYRSGVVDVDTDLITLTRHVHYEQMKCGSKTTGALTMLLQSIQLSCKFVGMNVRRVGLANLTGLANEVNIQGEEVKKLDVVANLTFINALRSSGMTAILVSEENEREILVEDQVYSGRKYCVVFDPLDGSSNIDAGVSIGSIFGIYKVQDETSPYDMSNILRPGKEMVAAGYAMYGSFTTMVLSTGHGVNGYTLDPVSYYRIFI
jgi:fructose-1,6-bisphosphatase I